MYARARHGVQRKMRRHRPRCEARTRRGTPSRPKAGDVAADAICMVAPAPARRPRGDGAYLSFRRLGGRGSTRSAAMT